MSRTWPWKIFFEKCGFPHNNKREGYVLLNHKSDFFGSFSDYRANYLDKKLFRNAKCLIDNTSIFEDFLSGWFICNEPRQ